MLTENDVIRAVREYLKSNGYEINSFSDTSTHGVDLVTTNKETKQQLYVEAKGETSSKEKTRRYSKPFTGSQINTHVSVAVTRCMREMGKKSEVKQAIALPYNTGHIEFVQKIKKSLDKLGIGIYWVSGDGRVTKE